MIARGPCARAIGGFTEALFLLHRAIATVTTRLSAIEQPAISMSALKTVQKTLGSFTA